jgi:LysM repeat protein
VQEGETLLGIAIDYGVSLENLQAANPEVDARFLSIGTVLIIPPPEGGFAVAATNLAPPPPAPVEMGEPACYALPTAGLYCLVAARNPGEAALENVSARVILAGADGLPLASAVAFAALDLIPAGATAPLAVLFERPPSQPILATGVEVLTGNIALEPAPEGRAAMLAVPELRGGLAAGRWTATGLALNASDRAVSETWAALILFGDDGAIVGYRKQWLGGPLGPGESQAFTLTADVLGGAVDHFNVLAEGYP